MATSQSFELHVNQTLDFFEGLPGDILLKIFEKIVITGNVEDVKFLVQCCTVSKRFNSHIPLIHSLSLRCLPEDVDEEKEEEEGQRGSNRFLVLQILRKFRNIRCLTFPMEAILGKLRDRMIGSSTKPFSDCFKHLRPQIYWKGVVYDGDGSAGENSSYSYAAISYVPLDEQEIKSSSRINQDVGEGLRGSYLLYQILLVSDLQCGLQRMEWFHKKVASKVNISHVDRPQQLVIIDRMKEGEITLGCKHIAELKSAAGRTLVEDDRVEKFVFLPMLRLPKAGIVLKDATLVITQSGEKDFEVDDILNWRFKEEQKIFAEAMTLILRNHKDELKNI